MDGKKCCKKERKEKERGREEELGPAALVERFVQILPA